MLSAVQIWVIADSLRLADWLRGLGSGQEQGDKEAHITKHSRGFTVGSAATPIPIFGKSPSYKFGCNNFLHP